MRTDKSRGLMYAFMPATGSPAAESLLLARSIRRFGGALASEPLVAVSPRGEGRLDRMRSDLEALSAEVCEFDSGRHAWDFPFAAKVYAAAEAEELAEGQVDVLAWVDSDTVVLNEPREFLLPQDKSLGYRPVMHTLIGSPYELPVDAFWSMVYAKCGTPTERIFPVRAPVDGALLRAYFNAGILVVRPERGLLRRWRDGFDRLYRLPEFQAFYREKALYRIFFHQTILAAEALSTVSQEETLELPSRYNYPIFFHKKYPEADRLARLDDAVTFRYDEFSFFDRQDWSTIMRMDEPLKSWLVENVANLRATR